jgi:hypothetical protein
MKVLYSRACLFWAVAFVILVTFAQLSCAKRGGGVRISSSRSSISTKTVNIRVGSSHSRRPWGSGYTYRSWRSYGQSGYIYGYVYYTRTRHYHDHPDREPQICSNDYDIFDENGTVYNLFICPGAYQSEDYNYCCGDEDRQTCCRFWDSGLRVFGVIAGLLLFIILCCLASYFCCFRRTQPEAPPFFQSRVLSRRHQTRSQNVQYTVANTGSPAVRISSPLSAPKASYPQTDGQPFYPVSPATQPTGIYPPNTAGQYPPAPVNSTTGGFIPINDPSYPAVGGTMSPPPPYPASPYPPSPCPTESYPSAPYPTEPYPPAPYPSQPGYPPYPMAPTSAAQTYQSQTQAHGVSSVPPYSASPAPSYTH